jgi:UDPglucose--hexose-1-phosphate uridylyltransferase
LKEERRRGLQSPRGLALHSEGPSMTPLKQVRKVVVLNPLKGFEAEEQVLERRFDPLTEQSTFVARGRLNYVRHFFDTDRALLTKLAESSKPNCPFCPDRVELSTPKFPEAIAPAGRIKVGRCIALPSLHAHADFNAVIVLGSSHLAYPKELEADLIAEGLQAGLEALKAAWRADSELTYGVVIMNYLPPAGSSIIHPHMQALSSNVPFNLQRLLLSRSYKHYLKASRNYWLDLLEREREARERLIAEGSYVAWLAPLAPLRFFEVWGVFKEPLDPSKVGSEALREAAEGVSKILSFYEDEGILCFNMALILPPFGSAQAFFNPQVRLCARLGLSQPFLNDFWALAALLMESEVFEAPEDYAARAKRYF